jgi:hypothetical protein
MKTEEDPSAAGGKTKAAGERGDAPLNVSLNCGYGARARFDNASHAGRRSPVREALRLPGGAGRESPEDPVAHRESGERPGCRHETGETGRSKRELDPWAEDEPIFGQREVAHALSPTPGTPPLGNLAVEPPPGWKPDAPAPGAATTGGATGHVLRAGALRVLHDPIRIEMELERCGRWACGLAERASPTGLEISLGFRGVGTRDFLRAGRRVRLLVSPPQPRGAPERPGRRRRRGRAASGGERPFQLHTRILWVDPPSVPGGAVRAQVAIDTADTAALARWEGLLERTRE